MKDKVKIIELLGTSSTGKTTVKNELSKESNLVDTNKITPQFKSRLLKTFYGVFSLIKIYFLSPVWVFKTHWFIIKYLFKKPKRMIHRIATVTLVLDRLFSCKEDNKYYVFCEAYLKSIWSIYILNKRAKPFAKKLLEKYHETFDVNYIYLKIPPKTALKRMKKRRRKTDLFVLNTKNPLPHIAKRISDYEEFINLLDIDIMLNINSDQKQQEVVQDILKNV
ncbi:MAG: hypothetical protein ACMXYD_03715 [Candidatus Woesearchaeota archaeon]